jgi:glycosyltransferase involved in cell wall biosynthesis
MRSAIAAALGGQFSCPVIFQHNDLIPGQAVGRLVRLAAVRSTLTFALSETIARDLDPERTLGTRVVVVRPGVDVARFDPSAARADPPEVLVLGSITPWKRPELALEACALARRAHPAVRLRVVGAPFADDGPALLVELRRRAAALGFAELPGPSAHPARELGRAYCLLHCAEQEPFGMAVLEALAAARPVVVPRAGGPAEIVDDSCALTYPPGDARAAADALGALLSDPARAAGLGEAGRERARREFDLGRAQERYAAALTAALAP